MRLFRRWIIFSCVVSLFSAPVTARAAEFNPEHIISDSEMRDASTMDLAGIRQFLMSKGGLDAEFDIDPIDGMLKNGSQLIHSAAERYQVNPRYILALLQKESSIVETGRPTDRQRDWAAGYALCDGCARSAPLAKKYKGLGRQIDAGAGWMDWYLRNAASLGKLQAGQQFTADGAKLTPTNLVTAALYSYTPHAHGNRLLWSILQRWFGGVDDLRLPDGALVRNMTTGAVAVIEGGKFRPILNRSVLVTRFNTTNIIDLNQYDFATLQERSSGAPLRFADLSLVRSEDGAIYLLIGTAKRLIPSTEVFRQIGFNPEEVEDVRATDIAEYADAAPITADSSFPTGQLLQNAQTGGVYYVEAGVKHPLVDRAILTANFFGDRIVRVTPAALAGLENGDAVKFSEGTLVKTKDDPTVYLISGSKKRPFTSEKIFLAFGYTFTNVLVTSSRALALHELGEPMVLTAQ